MCDFKRECWGHGFSDTRLPHRIEHHKTQRAGLGFLPGSHCPHYDGEAQRRPLYHSLIGEGFPAGYAMDDDAAVHFVGQEIREVVTARADAGAYRVERVNGQVVETRLESRLLPA